MTKQNPGSKLKKQDNKKPVKGQSKRGLEKERGPSNEDREPTTGLNGTMNNMPTQPAKFAEFFRRLAPLMPIYRSIELACVAARQGSQWILISGKAVLSTEPCTSAAQIGWEVKLKDIVALHGRIPAERISDLVRDLRESYVVRELDGISVRLTAKGAPDYIWQLPRRIRSRSCLNLWGRALALDGCDRDLSSLPSDSTLHKIDHDLYLSTSPYNGFDWLCDKLGLPARLNNLTSLLRFQVSADLPARVTKVGFVKKTFVVDFNCFGTPDLKVMWSAPQPVVERIPATSWDREPSNMACRAPLLIPDGADGAEVILSFGEHEADVASFYLDPNHATQHSVGEPFDFSIVHEVLKDDEDICEHRKIQELVKGEAPAALAGAQESPKPSAKPRLPDYRSKLMRAILAQILALLRKKRKATDLEICRGLDVMKERKGEPKLPIGWSNNGMIRLFADACTATQSQIRQRVHGRTNKVRTDLRERGWQVPYSRGPHTPLTTPLTG